MKQAKATLHLLPEYSHPDIVRGLSEYSHIWVIFLFHKSQRNQHKNTVRPPRLGGNEKRGIFATRSNFRPNPIGLSVVALEKIEYERAGIVFHITGGDMLSDTPVLDIKPYLPYADSLPEAVAGIANEPPKKHFTVIFSDSAATQIANEEQTYDVELGELIKEILSFDVRPAYYEKKAKKAEFCSKLYNYELTWRIEGSEIIVTDVRVSC